MSLIVGYGTLLGATVTAIIMLLATVIVAWKAHFLTRRSGRQSFEQDDADVNFAFSLEGLVAFYRENPFLAPFAIFGVPILAGATIGFVVENVLRIF